MINLIFNLLEQEESGREINFFTWLSGWSFYID